MMNNPDKRIPLKVSQDMYALAGVNRDVLHDVLRSLAKKHLKPAMRKDWSPENPTRNFCYVVAEWLYTLHLPNGSVGPHRETAWKLVIPGDTALHYYVRNADGVMLDLTAEQFLDFDVVNYGQERKATFMYPSPSRRARELHEAYHAAFRARR
jgi:hypothetical protein